MAVEIETVGTGANWYGQGLYENMSVVDATTVEGVYFEGVGGGSVAVIAPLELTVLAGFGINWNVWAKHIELHGVSHWSTAFSDGWNQQTTNFSAKSILSHTQTVEGDLTWSVAGSETWEVEGNSDVIVAGDAIWSSTATMSLEAQQMTIRGLTVTNISGATSAQLSGGGNSVLLNATEASLLCGEAGIRATATSTVISGAKVEIGLPNGPVPVATATQVDTVNADVTDLEAGVRSAVTQLREKLAELNRKFSKSLLGKLS
jgi:hypothetical protein